MKKKATEHMNFRVTDKNIFSVSSYDQGDCSFAYFDTHNGLGRVCNVKFCILDSDLIW